MTDARIEAFGDDALTARLAQPQPVIAARAAALRASGAFAEAVPTPGALTVVFDPGALSREAATTLLREAMAAPVEAADAPAPPFIVPVRYDGADLDRVAEHAGLTRTDVIEAHVGSRYAVAFLGFTPGFAYLDGLPCALSGVPRLSKPRLSVPQGSIGVAGARCGLYALPGPGGWPLIGRTDAALFRSGAAAPFALAPGRAVRFEPVA